MALRDKGRKHEPLGTPSLWRRLVTVGVSALAVALALVGMLPMWGAVGWLASGMFIRGVRATFLESLALLLFLWALLLAMCALLGRLCAFGIEAFSSEGRRASWRLGFGVVSGAIAGALASGALTVSLVSGQPDVPDRVPTSYWLWGPGLAVVVGITGVILERNHER